MTTLTSPQAITMRDCNKLLEIPFKYDKEDAYIETNYVAALEQKVKKEKA